MLNAGTAGIWSLFQALKSLSELGGSWRLGGWHFNDKWKMTNEKWKMFMALRTP